MSDGDKGPSTRRIGDVGEEAAAEWYRAHGYTVTARNVREAHNEIDLICEDGTGLAFVEVKTRTQRPDVRSPFGRPADAVDAGKRRRTVLAAEAWLRAHPTDKQPRIDIAEVYLKKNDDGTHTVTSVRVFRNAVQAK